MHQAVHERLLAAARESVFVYYGEIAAIAGLNLDLDGDRGALGRILGEISQYEHANGRPLLSVVAVNKDSQYPSKGFFDLARELNKLQGTGAFAELGFFSTELQAAFDYWSKQGSDE